METSGAEPACRGGVCGAGPVRGGTGEERRRKERRRQDRRGSVSGAGGVLQAAERTASGVVAGPHGADSLRGGVLPDWISYRAERSNGICASVRAHDVSGLAEFGEDGIHQAGATERRGGGQDEAGLSFALFFGFFVGQS